MTRADSIRQTASMARPASALVGGRLGPVASAGAGGRIGSSGTPDQAAWSKSDISYTRRTSMTSPSRAGQRVAHSTASSLDRAWMSQ
jgi:hypothetical protein